MKINLINNYKNIDFFDKEVNFKDNSNSNVNKNIDNYSKETKEAIKIFEEKGIKLNKNEIKEIDNYINSGNKNEKLQVLKIAFDKEVPIDSEIFKNIENSENMSLIDFLPLKNENLQVSNKKDFLVIQNIVNSKIEEAVFDMLDSLENNDDDVLNEKEVLKLKKDVKKIIDDIDEEVNYVNSADFQRVRVFLEEKTTEKIIAVKKEFNLMKKELLKDLNKLDKIENINKKQMLANIIEKLDNKIMKSDITNYISLKGERDLVKFSNMLQKANNLLDKNDFLEAKKIVSIVSKELSQMVFKPSIKKVMVSVNYVFNENYNYDDVMEQTAKNISSFSNQEKSIYSVLNFMRSLGINNEADIFSNLFTNFENKNTKDFKEFKQDLNLKSLLISLSKKSISSKERVNANSNISMINGNQVKQSVNRKKDFQNLSFDLPIEFKGEKTMLKIFIRTNENEKLDFLNFNMYFVLNTKDFKEIGIRISCINQNINVEVKNDILSKNLEKIFREHFKNTLYDLGYNLESFILEKWDFKINSEEIKHSNFDFVNNEINKSYKNKNLINDKNNKEFDIKI